MRYLIPDGFSISRQDLDEVNDLVGPLWEDFRGGHVLITGGSGFFGQWLTECLLWANQVRSLDLKVTILSRDPDRFLSTRAAHLSGHRGLSFLQGSIGKFDSTGHRFTKIIHAASESNVDGNSDWGARHLATAIDGTRNILRIGAEHQIDSFLLTSSGSVYLPSPDREIDGRFAEGPRSVDDYESERSVYGQSKRMMEIMTAIAGKTHGFRATIARCFAFVGPHLTLDANYAIGNFINDVLRQRQIVVSGDGTPLRSYLYASDLAVWLLTILAEGRSGRPYNVGGAKAYSIGEIASAANSWAEIPRDVVIRQQPVVGAKPSAYLPDVSRAEKELGLSTRVTLRDAIGRTLDWHRARSSSGQV
jgi:nucleoside-diphosphate-sugar epimerase